MFFVVSLGKPSIVFYFTKLCLAEVMRGTEVVPHIRTVLRLV